MMPSFNAVIWRRHLTAILWYGPRSRSAKLQNQNVQLCINSKTHFACNKMSENACNIYITIEWAMLYKIEMDGWRRADDFYATLVSVSVTKILASRTEGAKNFLPL